MLFIEDELDGCSIYEATNSNGSSATEEDINTPNDIVKVFNRGSQFEAGREEIGFSYKGLEAITARRTKRIITFRPAKNRGN